MLTFKEFTSIFKGTDFNEDELKLFYYSVKKSVILRSAGRKSWPEIFKIEERCQWPVVRRIDNPDLPIYKGADKELLDSFIKTIHDEKNIRDRKPFMDKVRYWTLLQSIIDERIDLFPNIFGFTQKEMNYCETIAERYLKRIDNRIEARKKNVEDRPWDRCSNTGRCCRSLVYLQKRQEIISARIRIHTRDACHMICS